MLHAKEEVQQLLDILPETVSFDDIQYHIYVPSLMSHIMSNTSGAGHPVRWIMSVRGESLRQSAATLMLLQEETCIKK